MGYVKAGVDAGDQGVAPVHEAVGVDPPALVGQAPAALAVTELQHGMGGQARAQGGRDVFMGPVDDVDQGLPERFLGQIALGHICPGDDQGVQAVLLDLLKALVEFRDVLGGLGAAFELLEGERMHVELGDLVALPHEAKELALGGRQGGVRHHVEQSDVEFANVLVDGELPGNHRLPFLDQAAERRQCPDSSLMASIDPSASPSRQGRPVQCLLTNARKSPFVLDLGELGGGDGISVTLGNGL